VKKILSFVFSENAHVSIFVEIRDKLSKKNAWLLQFFFVDSSSPFFDLLLAQKPLYLVGTVLNRKPQICFLSHSLQVYAAIVLI